MVREHSGSISPAFGGLQRAGEWFAVVDVVAPNQSYKHVSQRTGEPVVQENIIQQFLSEIVATCLFGYPSRQT